MKAVHPLVFKNPPCLRRGSGRVTSRWIEREGDEEFVEPDDRTLWLPPFLEEDDAQGPLPQRYFSYGDMLANALGALLASLWFVLEPRLRYVSMGVKH